MVATLKIDKAGRVVIPKPMRDQMGLSSGDSLEIENRDGSFVMRPVQKKGRFRRKHGILVFSAGRPISTGVINALIQQDRDERHAHIMGLE